MSIKCMIVAEVCFTVAPAIHDLSIQKDINLVKSVISIMIMHMCLARTMMSLPVSSHLATSWSNFTFSRRKFST